jgi:hypothetical protein
MGCVVCHVMQFLMTALCLAATTFFWMQGWNVAGAWFGLAAFLCVICWGCNVSCAKGDNRA